MGTHTVAQSVVRVVLLAEHIRYSADHRVASGRAESLSSAPSLLLREGKPTYNKLFTRILNSSVWLEPHATRIVWVTLLAAMDEDGFCQFASVGNIAQAAIVTREEAAEAIRVLESSDPDSSDPEFDGRRIQRVPGGWMVLNSAKYRNLAKREQVKEQTRERVRKFRLGDGLVTPGNAPVTLCNGDETPGNEIETPSEAEAYTEAKNQNLLLNETLSDKHGHIPLAGPIYDKYPRHQGKVPALKAITKQYKLIARSGFVEYTDRYGQPTRVVIENDVAAAAFLQESAAEFASSPAGGKGEFVPHPATWFNQERYRDDRQEWYREAKNGNGSGKASREARTRAIIEELVTDSD